MTGSEWRCHEGRITVLVLNGSFVLLRKSPYCSFWEAARRVRYELYVIAQ